MARLLRPAAPLADAADATVFFQTDGSPGRVVTGYPTRNRFFPAHSGHARRSLASPHRPGDGPGAPDAGLPVDLALRAGRHDSDRPHAARLRGGRVRASCGPLAAHRLRRRLRCIRPVRLRPLQGAADHGGVGCRGRRRARRNGLSQSGPPGADALPSPARTGRSGLLLRLRSSLLASQSLAGGRAVGGVLAIAVAYGATAVAAFGLARLWIPVAVPLLIATPVAVLSAFSARFALARRVVERLAPRPFARDLLRHPGIGRGHSSIEDATVMFADMVGSTALAERLGEDAFRKVMNRYYSAATAAVEANDGHGGGVHGRRNSRLVHVGRGRARARQEGLPRGAADLAEPPRANRTPASRRTTRGFGCASAFIPGASSPDPPAPSTATASRRSATASSSPPGSRSTARRCRRTARTSSC